MLRLSLGAQVEAWRSCTASRRCCFYVLCFCHSVSFLTPPFLCDAFSSPDADPIVCILFHMSSCLFLFASFFVAFRFSRCRVLFVPLFIFFVILCLWFPLPCPFVVSCVCLSVVTVVFTRQSSFSLNPHPANSAVAAPAPGQAFPLYVKCSPPGKFSAS